MPIFSPEKALRDFVKTPVILGVIVRGVDQQRARQATDGPDGWSVLEVMCHLNDYETIFFDRARQIVETDLPKFGTVDHEALVTINDYAGQDFAGVLASYSAKRRVYVDFLRQLSADQWQRRGIHPSWGEITLVEHVINTTLHDVNHIEQIIKALGSAAPPAQSDQ